MREHFDCRPGALIRELDLLRPIYRQTAAYGHFGRSEPEFTWERADRAELLREAAKSGNGVSYRPRGGRPVARPDVGAR